MSHDTSVDIIDVLACVLFVGIGLTSLDLTLWPLDPSDDVPNVTQLVEVTLAREAGRPDELLISGAGLESLVVNGLPEVQRLATVPLRLVADDTPFTPARDLYWVLARANQRPKLPDRYEERVLQEHEGIVLLEWSALERVHTARLADVVHNARAEYVGTDGKPSIACTGWRFGRLFCGPNPWNWVGATEVQISGKARRCIWAHPLADRELRITFPRIYMHSDFQGGYGFADSAIGDGTASPVTFRVLIDGEEQVKRVLPNRAGWNPFSLGAEDRKPGAVELTFTVSAPSDGRRHFCFDGEMRPGPDRKSPDNKGKD